MGSNNQKKTSISDEKLAKSPSVEKNPTSYVNLPLSPRVDENLERNKEETILVCEGPPGIYKGYLQYVSSVDIIVNSAPTHMKLHDYGRVSKTILAYAGPDIQMECDKNYPNGIGLGQVAITKGYKLPYCQVFHCTVQPMTYANCFTEMAKVIKKCLMEADGRDIVRHTGERTKAQTIAFPFFGIGAKGLSPQICRVFYRTMLSYLLGPTESLINSYIIMTPRDEALIRVIQDLKPLPEMQQSTYEFCYPKSWNETQNNVDLINLNPGTNEYNLIYTEFRTSGPTFTNMLSIQRIQNKTLYKRYLEKKCENKLIKKSHEKQLWFPVENNNHAKAIYTNGLNDNYIKDRRNGKGYYFCVSASLADDMRKTRNMPLSMFYCSVAVGIKEQVGRRDYNKDNLPRRIHSTVDNTQAPTMYTIYDEGLFYPRYLVTFENDW